MEYDKTDIPAGYDRARGRSPEVIALWMNTISAHTNGFPIRSVLDLGCGTGRFSQALATHFNAVVIALDPSRKMVEQATRKRHEQRVHYGLARAQALPLMDHSVDLIFMSMVFHHFENAILVVRECRRVLRDGGTVFLRAGTVEQIPSYPYVDFFPTSRLLLERRLNTTTAIRETFEAAGFQAVAVGLLRQEIAPSYGAYVDRLAAGGDSVLASLSPSEFEAGLAALRAHAAQVDVQPVSEPIDFFVFR